MPKLVVVLKDWLSPFYECLSRHREVKEFAQAGIQSKVSHTKTHAQNIMTKHHGPGQFLGVAMTPSDICGLRVEETLNWLLSLSYLEHVRDLLHLKVFPCSHFSLDNIPCGKFSFLTSLNLLCCSGGSFLLPPSEGRESRCSPVPLHLEIIIKLPYGHCWSRQNMWKFL